MADKLTPLKPADAQLEGQRLNTLINSMADGVITVDNRIQIDSYNASALNLLDLNTIAKGTLLSRVLSPLDKNNQLVDIAKFVSDTKMPLVNRDFSLKYQDGSLINLYLSVAPVRLGFGQGGMGGFVIVLRDITREKSLEEERDDFISTVSHELRTPITITEGNISNAEFIVNQSGDLSQVKQALKEAHSQVLFLADMINDLATLSRAERGKLTLEVEAVNIAALIKSLAANYLPECEAKGLKLQIVIDPSLELLHSSKLYVQEILQNFMTNAIKYTNEGQISLSAKQGANGVTLAISDSGIGISKSDREKVFDKFFRSEDVRTKQTKGTGLGLYVTMKLARLIHADIELESELNKGSTFSITVPNLNEVKPPTKKPPAEAAVTA